MNSDDKLWVACNKDYEIETVINAISDILDLDDAKKTLYKEEIKTFCEQTCEMLEQRDVVYKKPRIPFYIIVLSFWFLKHQS